MNHVASAAGRKQAFVEKEFIGDKPGEGWLSLNPGLQFADSPAAAFAFAARQRDVRMVRTRFSHEAAKAGGCRNALLEREQFGSEPDAGKEDPGALEESQCLKPHGNRRRMYFAKPRDQARVFLRAGIA